MAKQTDYLVVGAGISGSSVACELSRAGTTLLIEAESVPGYHSTGRSAALFTPNFGNPVVRSINKASHGFFKNPPKGFDQTPLLTPRGALTVASAGEEQALNTVLALGNDEFPIQEIPSRLALEKAPLLRSDKVAAAIYEPGVDDINVDALHQSYLRAFKENGGQLRCSERVVALNRQSDGWEIMTDSLQLQARVVVNAAGAWAGELGVLAGASSQMFKPMRRTAIVIDAAQFRNGLRSMPLIDFAGCQPYLKPDGDRLMASLGDETPSKALDVLNRVDAQWAGLRTFTADGSPIVGFDAEVPGFFWLAGQGGYGIMMAPALSKLSTRLILERNPSCGHTQIDLQRLSPSRFEYR